MTITDMLSLISPSDISSLPEPHRSVAERAVLELYHGRTDLDQILAESAMSSKSLTKRQISLMAFFHSWRGDIVRAQADAEFAISLYLGER